MTEIDYEKKFAKMSLGELVTFCEEHDKDWQVDVPEWSKPIEKHLERALAKERFDMTLNDLEIIDNRLSKIEIEFIDEALRDAMDQTRPIGYIWDVIGETKAEIKRLEESITVLLKQQQNEPANITVGQLNRLKGGLPIQ